VDKELIENLITSEIADAECVFEGDSCSFKLLVISKSFREISLIEQHKMVLLPLKKQFESGELHALSIETRVN
jgi:acid stress-induced BolA-like protein IbaG/YrbA